MTILFTSLYKAGQFPKCEGRDTLNRFTSMQMFTKAGPFLASCRFESYYKWLRFARNLLGLVEL